MILNHHEPSEGSSSARARRLSVLAGDPGGAPRIGTVGIREADWGIPEWKPRVCRRDSSRKSIDVSGTTCVQSLKEGKSNVVSISRGTHADVKRFVAHALGTLVVIRQPEKSCPDLHVIFDSSADLGTLKVFADTVEDGYVIRETLCTYPLSDYAIVPNSGSNKEN